MLVIGAVACLVLTSVLCQVPKKASEPNSQLCDSCKQVVSNLDNLLLKHTSKAELDILLKQICSALPDDLHLDCEETVLLNTSLIGQTFLHELQLDQVCINLGLCPTPEPVEAIPPPKTDGIECSLCKLVIDQVKSKLSDHATQDEIKAALEQVCDLLPYIVQDECTQFIEKYEAQIIQMLLSAFSSEQICSSLGLCSSEVKVFEIATQPPNPDDIKCELCKSVIGIVKSQLGKNATIAQVKQILGKVCNLVPIVLKSKCRNFVNKYTEQLIQLLLSKLAPKEICTRLGLCKADVEEMLDFEDASPPSRTDSIKCDKCQKLISTIKSRLGPNPTPDEVKNFLATVCNSVPSIYRSKCRQFISQHETELIQLLSNLSPREICQRLGFCGADVGDMTVNDMFQLSTDDTQCSMCKLIVEYVKSMLKSPAIQEKIKAALKKACGLLPPRFSNQCAQFVDNYEPQIIQILLSFTSDQVCSTFGLCAADLKDFKDASPPPSTDSIKCNKCQKLISTIKSRLGPNPTPDEVKNFLATACNSVPSIYRSKCQHFISQHETELIQLLLSNLSPREICQRLGFCGADVGDMTGKSESLMFVPESK
jgi:saposin